MGGLDPHLGQHLRHRVIAFAEQFAHPDPHRAPHRRRLRRPPPPQRPPHRTLLHGLHRAPTAHRSTSTNSAGNPPPPDTSPYPTTTTHPLHHQRYPVRLHTPATTPKRGLPATSSAAHLRTTPPPPTPSKIAAHPPTPSACDGLADLIDRTITHHRPPTSPTSSPPPPASTSTSAPPSAPSSSAPHRRHHHTVATIRRTLLNRGHAVLGRTHTAGHLWFKATLLNPHTTPHDLRTLLDLVTHATTELLTPTTHPTESDTPR
ncbi:hypothetical protein SCALM49S_03564 [Streptomyces californicus]